MSAVVIGGGVAGLAAAHRLARSGEAVVLLEASDRLGGMVAPVTLAGVEVDAGAEAFARRLGIADELCATLGLEIQGPTGGPRIRWSLTESWPGGDGVLGIPASPNDPALRGSLNDEELAVALAEPGLPDEVGADAITVGELVTARLGSAVTERLVAPVTKGVYGMPPERMALKQFAPRLIGPGSLYVKVAAARGSRSSVAQPVGGLIRLVDALETDIRAHGGEIRLGARPNRITPGWVVEVNESLWADRVIVACPAGAAAELLGQVGVEVTPPASNPSQNVMLALDPALLDGAPVGSGVLLGQPLDGLKARALTHYSAKWPWSGQEVEILRLSYAPDIEPDVEMALADAGLFLGRNLPAALDFAVTRWPEVPRSLTPDARADLLSRLPEGIRLAGAWVFGNGIEAAIASGLEAAS